LVAQVSQEMIAIQAEDHYVRVHTDSGSELVPMRFAEAVEELALAFACIDPGGRPPKRSNRCDGAAAGARHGWRSVFRRR
jgi:hypothetical protein